MKPMKFVTKKAAALVDAKRSMAGRIEIRQRPAVNANGQLVWSTRDLLFPPGTKPATVYRKKVIA